jgi:PAS domain-containing protein
MNSKEPKSSDIPNATGLKRLPVEMSDLLQVITEAAGDCAILLLDNDGNVMTWNAAAQRIKGRTADDATVVVARNLS